MAEPHDSFSPHEEAEGGESDSNWIVSYADMMTLLMAFFAIMFSYSKVDQAALDKVRESVSKEMGIKVTLPFQGLHDKLKELIDKHSLQERVQLHQTGSSITVVFQGSALFEAGSAELSPNYRDTISDLLDILRHEASAFPIVIEGHTDDSPISSVKFPSNWELSSSRASLILRMLEAKSFPHQNLQSQGFADTRPVAPNRDAQGQPVPQNQMLNRRITIKILKEQPPG